MVAVVIAVYALLCALMSAGMGIGVITEYGEPLPGLVFVSLSVLAVWYVIALFASLWLRRDGRWITSGLWLGFVILGFFVTMFGHEIYRQATVSVSRSSKWYLELLLPMPILVLSLTLTGVLLLRPSLVRVTRLDS